MDMATDTRSDDNLSAWVRIPGKLIYVNLRKLMLIYVIYVNLRKLIYVAFQGHFIKDTYGLHMAHPELEDR